jgi:hypothetical protein
LERRNTLSKEAVVIPAFRRNCGNPGRKAVKKAGFR